MINVETSPVGLYVRPQLVAPVPPEKPLPLLEFVRAHGVTVVHVLPGRANALAGQSGIFRTYGRTAEAMKVRSPAGILVNLGEVPKAAHAGKAPATRMGTANLVRNAFAQAQAYAKKKETAKEPPTPNLKK